MNEDAAIRRLRYGGLVRRKWASCGKARLHLDCTWIRYSHRAKNGEPTVEDRSRAHHPLAAPVYCWVEEGPRASLRRLRVRLPRGSSHPRGKNRGAFRRSRMIFRIPRQASISSTSIPTSAASRWTWKQPTVERFYSSSFVKPMCSLKPMRRNAQTKLG